MQITSFLCRIVYNLWPVWLYQIFPHYLVKGMIFGKVFLNIKFVLISATILSKMFLILRRIQPDIIISVHLP